MASGGQRKPAARAGTSAGEKGTWWKWFEYVFINRAVRDEARKRDGIVVARPIHRGRLDEEPDSNERFEILWKVNGKYDSINYDTLDWQQLKPILTDRFVLGIAAPPMMEHLVLPLQARNWHATGEEYQQMKAATVAAQKRWSEQVKEETRIMDHANRRAAGEGQQQQQTKQQKKAAAAAKKGAAAATAPAAAAAAGGGKAAKGKGKAAAAGAAAGTSAAAAAAGSSKAAAAKPAKAAAAAGAAAGAGKAAPAAAKSNGKASSAAAAAGAGAKKRPAAAVALVNKKQKGASAAAAEQGDDEAAAAAAASSEESGSESEDDSQQQQTGGGGSATEDASDDFEDRRAKPQRVQQQRGQQQQQQRKQRHAAAAAAAAAASPSAKKPKQQHQQKKQEQEQSKHHKADAGAVAGGEVSCKGHTGRLYPAAVACAARDRRLGTKAYREGEASGEYPVAAIVDEVSFTLPGAKKKTHLVLPKWKGYELDVDGWEDAAGMASLDCYKAWQQQDKPAYYTAVKTAAAANAFIAWKNAA